MTIVKVQMPDPKRSNDPEPKHALVFAKGRTDSTLVPISEDLRAKMAGRHEAFFKAERVQSWAIGDEVPKQDW